MWKEQESWKDYKNRKPVSCLCQVQRDNISQIVRKSFCPSEDKEKIKALLKKPWNPYVVGRHATLTQKSRTLKEATLRVFAGWTPDSDMPKRYVHLFGNAVCEEILEEYGLLDKGIRYQASLLKSKSCPNCSEPNELDSKFHAKCRMVLTYDAYNETLESQKEKESEVQILKDKYKQDMKSVREEMENKFQQILARIDTRKLS
jgi:hypothetical protein